VDYFGPALSRADLAARGWTDALIKKYLGDHDRRDSVNHWANFTGRDMYWTARVEMAEAMPAFQADLTASFRCRKLRRAAMEAKKDQSRAGPRTQR